MRCYKQFTKLWRLDPLQFSACRACYFSVTGGQKDVLGVVWNRSNFTDGKFRVVIYVFMANIACVVTENLDALQRWLTPCSVRLTCTCCRSAFLFIALIAFNGDCCVVPVWREGIIVSIGNVRSITGNNPALWITVAPCVNLFTYAFLNVICHVISCVAFWYQHSSKVIRLSISNVLSISERVGGPTRDTSTFGSSSIPFVRPDATSCR